MRALSVFTGSVVLGLVFAGNLAAQAAAPKDATGQCTDGSYTTAKTEARGCLKHGGVKTWFASSTTSAGASSSATTAPAPAATAAPSEASVKGSTKGQPKDATGQCTDGSYTTAKTQARGCLKHGGVKTWFGPAAGAAKTSAPAATAAPAAPAPSVPAATPSPAASTRASAPVTTPAQAPANPSDVWVNLSTKAYHCPGTKYYGTTKHGKYMSEADAKAGGFHPSYGKTCS
jgi:hypothetical protein